MEGVCEYFEHAFAGTRHLVALQLGNWLSDTKGRWGCIEFLVADLLKVVIFQLVDLVRVEQLLATKKKSFY